MKDISQLSAARADKSSAEASRRLRSIGQQKNKASAIFINHSHRNAAV